MFTSEDRLAKFTALNFKQSIPDPFRTYCQSALNLQIPSQDRGGGTGTGSTAIAVPKLEVGLSHTNTGVKIAAKLIPLQRDMSM